MFECFSFLFVFVFHFIGFCTFCILSSSFCAVNIFFRVSFVSFLILSVFFDSYCQLAYFHVLLPKVSNEIKGLTAYVCH